MHYIGAGLPIVFLAWRYIDRSLASSA